ncbi:Bet v1-like protein [Karstenula rhodostoma CBS 690.94]|uniref:Bet v1-like protein n=1 Tax=Karstenula rhodostoma CBS 690.94 TaxID=1392251 RepID=A0A9P4PEX8_9PLEO|nr:Bet v1-like protein [Karstenula rhodostoma CBS 690.94]
MSDSRIPTSTSVRESAVIEAPFSAVWHLIKLQDFSKFWSKLEKSEVVQSSSPETDVVKWTFKDGTELDVKQEEHSSIDHFITYSVISSQPALSYTSVVSTIRAYPVTSGKHEGQTFITWTGNFSSDADAGVIEDAKFKRRDALADLAKAAAQ